MIAQVYHDIFRIEIPLPKSPLKAVNCYAIKGSDRNLIVDTGMNRKECRQAFDAALNELHFDLKKTDFFFTHLHADHFGMVSILPSASSKVYFNHPDAKHMLNPERWNTIKRNSLRNGVPEEILNFVMTVHPSIIFQSPVPSKLCLLKEHDMLTVGDYTFECIETPGHTRGHLCLYEAKYKFLLAGDHLLEDITPNLSGWSTEDALKEYLTSLEKVNNYDIDLILPGHRNTFSDCRKRIAELQQHHKNRCNEIISIMESNRKPQNAYQIASQMTWDLQYDKWDDFPVYQRWFAAGEALSHIYYLTSNNLIDKSTSSEKVLFALRS